MKLFGGHEEGFVIMRVDTVLDFTETSAAAGLFTAGTGFIYLRGLFLNRVIFQGAIEVFVGKWIAQADIHW